MSELELDGSGTSVFEFDDESGPVSPRFQWSVHAVASRDRLELRARGAPLGQHEGALAISADELAALCLELEGLGLVDLVDEARARRVGVRINTLRVNGRSVRYLPSDVDQRLDPTDATRGIRLARTRVLAFLRAAVDAARKPSREPQ